MAQQKNVPVPVQGDRFFNKHIAVVGATGSGKSHTIATLLQKATSAKDSKYKGLNNSHIVIFDIHSEYQTAFPNAKVLGVDELLLPFWLLNSDELEEMFLESGDHNNYNQESLLRTIVTLCKEKENPGVEKVYFDSPLPFKIKSVLNCLQNLTRETKDADNPLHVKTKTDDKTFASDEEKLQWYSESLRDFLPTERSKINKGPYGDGSIDKFVRRISSKIVNPRLVSCLEKRRLSYPWKQLFKS